MRESIAMTTLYRYAFDATVFDEAKMELVVAGLVADIQPKPLKLLSMLLASGGAVVTREEIHETVWAGRLDAGNSNVLPMAVTKLRAALGERGAELIENVPRHGYRFAGRFERTVVGRRFSSPLTFARGDAVPLRPDFAFERLLGQTAGSEVWLARHRATDECRVYKFASDGARVVQIKREVGFARLLRDALGRRDDMLRVIDWNFASAPFFVESEYIGVDLAAWASEPRRLAARSRDERLQLFIRIAAAVAAAHGVGVLHRDIKPANILIADDGLACRLIDFGSGTLIEALDGAASLSASLSGGLRDQVTQGSFVYLAPELHRGQACTTKSDVYALGVLLYQLLIGDLTKPIASGWGCEIDDDLLREDVERATLGDPELRFASVDDLLVNLRTRGARAEERDRRRIADREAVAAVEALRRARARRPWLVATIVSLSAGLVVGLALYLQMRGAQHSLASQNATSKALNAFLADRFIAMSDPDVTGRSDVTVAEAAVRAADEADGSLAAASPEIRAAVHATLQRTFSRRSDFARAIREGEAALGAFAEEAAPDPKERLDVEFTLGGDRVESGQVDRAVGDAQAIAAEVAANGLAGSTFEARLWRLRAVIASERMRLDDSLDAYRRAWALAAALPDAPVQLVDGIEFEYADLLRMTSHFDDAESRLRDLLARQSARFGASDWRTCHTGTALAMTLGYLDRIEDGIAIARRSSACLEERLGRDNLRTAKALEGLAGLEFQADRYDEAAALYADVAKRYARTTSTTALGAVGARLNEALALQYAGRDVDAERRYASLVADLGATRPAADPQMQNLRYHLADCRLNLHRRDGVAELLAGLRPDLLAKAQIAPDWDGRLAYQRGRLAFQTGDFAVAIPLLRSAAEVIAAKHPDGPIAVADIRRLLEDAGQRTALKKRAGTSREVATNTIR